MRTSSSAVIIGLAVLTADQLTKLVATTLVPSALPFGGAVSIDPVGNGGLIGGIGVQRPDLLPAGSILAVVLTLAVSRRLTAGTTLGASLVLAGAIGNGLDRLRLGHVIDFLAIDLGFAQVVLNIADIALIVGLLMLLGAGRRVDSGRPSTGAQSESMP